MKNLVLFGLSAILAVPAFANHWNFVCPQAGGRTYKVLINNKKAKLVAPTAKEVFTFSEKGARRKVYKGGPDGENMLLAPNINFQLSQIPMGEKATFTYEVPGPNEALILQCETRPTFTRDPDLN